MSKLELLAAYADKALEVALVTFVATSVCYGVVSWLMYVNDATSMTINITIGG